MCQKKFVIDKLVWNKYCSHFFHIVNENVYKGLDPEPDPTWGKFYDSEPNTVQWIWIHRTTGTVQTQLAHGQKFLLSLSPVSRDSG